MTMQMIISMEQLHALIFLNILAKKIHLRHHKYRESQRLFRTAKLDGFVK